MPPRAKKKAAAPSHLPMIDGVRAGVVEQLARHFAQDEIQYAVEFLPLPGDDPDNPWLPTVMVYLQFMPVGSHEGFYVTQILSPYSSGEPLMNAIFGGIAERTSSRRVRLQEARAAGMKPDATSLVVEVPSG